MTRDQIISRLENGSTIVVSLPMADTELRHFMLDPDGKTVRSNQFGWLLQNELIRPCGDGLFDDSQTYELAQ